MILSPIRLVLMAIGAAVGLVVILAVVVLAAAFAGSPGECDSGDRQVESSPALADQLQAKLDQLNAQLDAGQAASITFDESEATSRGRQFLEDENAPIADLKICFNSDGPSASGNLDAVLGLDVTAKVSGDLFSTASIPVSTTWTSTSGPPRVRSGQLRGGRRGRDQRSARAHQHRASAHDNLRRGHGHPQRPALSRRRDSAGLQTPGALSSMGTPLLTKEASLLQQIRSFLAGYQPVRLSVDDTTPAAVLLLLYEKEGEPHIVLTRRTDYVEHHKGETSFPGGAFDAEDADLMTTALRETEEEIGVRPQDVEVLGRLDDIVTITDFLVSPFVGVLPSADYPFVANAHEVAELVEVPAAPDG